MSVSVYIAARFADQARARELREFLQAKGVHVTARWIDEEPGLEQTMTWEHRRYLAEMDVHDVKRAQVLVLVNDTGKDKIGTGGCHTEVGMALGMGMPIILLGLRTNIFHYLEQIETAASFVEVYMLLTREKDFEKGFRKDFEKDYRPTPKRSG